MDGLGDYHGTGVSLLVTSDNATGRIRFGDVANDTGLAPLDPTRSYSGVLKRAQQTIWFHSWTWAHLLPATPSCLTSCTFTISGTGEQETMPTSSP